MLLILNQFTLNPQIQMALPCGFEGPTYYFEEFFMFIQKYENLFNFPNTDLLVNNALVSIDVDIQNLEVFAENFDIRGTNSEYLIEFFQYLDKLTVRYDEFKSDENLEISIDAPLSAKKKHEIVYLANEIKNICSDIKCDTIVDCGSGLGYLDEQLFKTAHYNVLGLECNEKHYIAAKKRQRKYHVDSIERVKYIKHTINQESHLVIEGHVRDKFPESDSFCLAGLHACADLTVDVLDIFLKTSDTRALVIMPCCYHRMVMDNTSGTFKHFPLSKTLKSNEHQMEKYVNLLTVPFLRLATQPPSVKAESLVDLVFNLLARATLQLYADKHNCKLKRNKRKAVSLKTLNNDFEAYAVDAVAGFKLLHRDACLNGQYAIDKLLQNDYEKEIEIADLISIWRQISEVTFKKAAIFVLLQNCLQPAFENFVMYDRLIYLMEHGVVDCKYKRIMNEKISPRCLALIARK